MLSLMIYVKCGDLTPNRSLLDRDISISSAIVP